MQLSTGFGLGLGPRTQTPPLAPLIHPSPCTSLTTTTSPMKHQREMQTSEISSNSIFKTRTAGQNVACCGRLAAPPPRRLATMPHAASLCCVRFSFQTMRNALENTCFCVFGFSDRKCCCLCRHMFEYTWIPNSVDQVTDTRWALKQIYGAHNESLLNSLRYTL